MKKIFILFVIAFLGLIANAQTGTYKEITALQCDSLIKANSKNLNFVILDIRTPAEYDPKHIEGAINRNYYETFDQKLDSLDKQKRYLLHCQSGARSAGAFSKMKTKNFKEVYNLKGGIKDWINAGLPVTSAFSPLLMFVSDTLFTETQVQTSTTDTIKLMITNRANDTLKILSIDDFSNPEFTTDFDTDTMIPGASDYAFNVYYTPTDESPDSLIFTINTNGGTRTAKIYRRSVLSPICDCIQAETVLIYPNPASDYLYIYSNLVSKKEYLVSDINGKIVKRHLINNNDNIHKIEIFDLKPGFYFIKNIAGVDKSGTYKFIKN